MYDLERFTLKNMTECGTVLRKCNDGAETMEEVAKRIVGYFYEKMVSPQRQEPACALVRLYKTHPFGELDPELQKFALGILGKQPSAAQMKCLTLLATAGIKPEWNSRSTSAGHKAIPLLSKEMVSQVPMISNLIKQFGLEIDMVLNPDPNFLVELERKSYNVFHVAEAVGSPYIPAQQEFVIPFCVKSVLGFGGMLPSGNLFAVILFSRVPIPRVTAETFKPLALSVKTAILPFEEKVFA